MLFMDDLKLYGKNEKQVMELVRTVESFSKDIRMEFGMSKCAVLHVVKGKRHRVDGLELPSGEVMKDVDQEGYKYLGILQTDVMMTKEMKKKVRQEEVQVEMKYQQKQKKKKKVRQE